jgi:hypothetical protein
MTDHQILEMIAVRILRRSSIVLREFRTAEAYQAIRFNRRPISNAMLTILSHGEFDRMSEVNNGNPAAAPSCILDVEFTDDPADIFARDVTFRLETGGSLSGGITEGRYQLQFGYWLLKEQKSADK